MADTQVTNNTESKKSYPKYHDPIDLQNWKIENQEWEYCRVKEKMTFVDEDGKENPRDEVWGLRPYYNYPDGKKDILHVKLPPVRCHVYLKEGRFGKSRDVIQSYARNSEKFNLLVNFYNSLYMSFVDYILTHNCPKVIAASCKANIIGEVNGTSKVVTVTYDEYMKLYTKDTKNGGELSDQTTMIKEEFFTMLSSMFNQSSVLYVPEDIAKEPAKFTEITKYPNGKYKPKPGTTPEAAEKYKNEGFAKLILFTDKVTRDSYADKITFLQTKTGYYTTDYHVMVGCPNTMNSVLGINMVYDYMRLSVSKTAVVSYKLVEIPKTGVFCMLTPSVIKPREDKRLEEAQNEFGAATPKLSSDLLNDNDYDVE